MALNIYFRLGYNLYGTQLNCEIELWPVEQNQILGAKSDVSLFS